ncbi:hypothetical protein NCLIV_018470 [Neospora caninum Liverpool]|uniref:Transmembrane protein n=1 Tax=Neospora caninum (strain Liverpool) TaxID=572307 RepID=F0VEB3_NEOCL|nr:hypothetical protein NCLIV_018470 [Neospora caninum Liverpool]CBZ52057.1 hypothetical protein NCLIV_018470 [Neospora caninum Liverpool]CEL66018.1 TPA: hypothetical protein BN1204_018470 [Neospora caninum Liverpool]|eukprot:XP_003882089.1 hypothetical protein NCLIV_018470 [Neospora caninum Liverpool]
MVRFPERERGKSCWEILQVDIPGSLSRGGGRPEMGPVGIRNAHCRALLFSLLFVFLLGPGSVAGTAAAQEPALGAADGLGTASLELDKRGGLSEQTAGVEGSVGRPHQWGMEALLASQGTEEDSFSEASRTTASFDLAYDADEQPAAPEADSVDSHASDKDFFLSQSEFASKGLFESFEHAALAANGDGWQRTAYRSQSTNGVQGDAEGQQNGASGQDPLSSNASSQAHARKGSHKKGSGYYSGRRRRRSLSFTVTLLALWLWNVVLLWAVPAAYINRARKANVSSESTGPRTWPDFFSTMYTNPVAVVFIYMLLLIAYFQTTRQLSSFVRKKCRRQKKRGKRQGQPAGQTEQHTESEAAVEDETRDEE